MAYSSSEVQVQPDQENEGNDERRYSVSDRRDRHDEANQLCQRVFHDILYVRVDAINVFKA